MYYLLLSAFMGITIFTPLLIAKRKRGSNEFRQSDLVSALASITISTLGYLFTANFLVGWIISLAVMVPLSIKSADPGKSVVSIGKKILFLILPKNLQDYAKSIVIALVTAFAFLVVSLTHHVTPGVWVFIEILLITIASIFLFSRFGDEPLKSLCKEQVIDRISAKQNRNSVAIAIGATAIVLAVIANGTGNNPGSPSDSPSPINSESVPPQQRQILPSRANGGCPTGTTGISSSYCKAYGDTQYIPTDEYGGCPTGATGAGAGYCRLYR